MPDTNPPNFSDIFRDIFANKDDQTTSAVAPTGRRATPQQIESNPWPFPGCEDEDDYDIIGGDGEDEHDAEKSPDEQVWMLIHPGRWVDVYGLVDLIDATDVFYTLEQLQAKGQDYGLDPDYRVTQGRDLYNYETKEHYAVYVKASELSAYLREHATVKAQQLVTRDSEMSNDIFSTIYDHIVYGYVRRFIEGFDVSVRGDEVVFRKERKSKSEAVGKVTAPKFSKARALTKAKRALLELGIEWANDEFHPINEFNFKITGNKEQLDAGKRLLKKLGYEAVEDHDGCSEITECQYAVEYELESTDKGYQIVLDALIEWWNTDETNIPPDETDSATTS